MMLTEWSFPALDSGLPCEHGAGQRFDTQTQRAAAYTIYQSMLFETPYMVGSNYFMWVDEPALGISSTFPEDSNYGLVNEQGEPWPELTRAAAKINRRAVAYHGGQTVAVSAKIDEASGKITLSNAGRVAAESCPAAVWVDGEPQDVNVKIAAGGEAGLDVLKDAKPGPHFIVVQVDPQRVLPDIARRDHFVYRHVWVGPKPSGEVAVIGNPTDRLLKNVSLDGRAVVEELPPRSMRVVKLAPVAEPVFEDVSGPFVIDNGVLKLTKRQGPALIDDVSIGGVPLGRVVAVIHQGDQGGARNLWLHANRLVSIRRATTPVETVLVFTAEYHPPGPGGEQGGAWRAVYELRIPQGTPTFTSRLVSITNIDTKPWHLAAYYHYLPSHLGGDVAGDVPVAGKVPNYYGLQSGWKDPAAGGVGAAYGAFAPEPMRGWFWLDDYGQHPDISRDIDKTLAPGETWTAADPPATVFGVTGDVAQKPWREIAADIAARHRCTVKIWR
jgi:hypothetical protein